MKHRVWLSTTTTTNDEQVGRRTTRNTKVAVFGGNLLSQRVDAKVCQYTVEDRDAALEMSLSEIGEMLCEFAGGV